MQGILETLRKCPFTLLISAATVLGFVFFKPADIEVFPASLILVKLVFASFLHLNLNHLILNLGLWLVIGWHLEPQIGTKRLIFVAVLSTLVGGLLETVLIDSRFIGLSAACYGLLGVLIWQRFAEGKGTRGFLQSLMLVIVLAALDMAFNSSISSQQVANAAHTGGLMAGLFSSLGFGRNQGDTPNRIFRPMEESDVAPILEIIYDHDEDDGEEAEEAFEETLADKYVMTYEGRVMMLELRHVLQSAGVRHLFIATSDYIDEDTGEDIYLAARNFYEDKLNARRELRLENFYAPGEAKYIYSLPVGDPDELNKGTLDIPTENTVRFVGLEEAPESDTSYVVLWEEMGPDDVEPKSSRATKSFPEMIAELKTYGGKALFLSLPEYLSDNHSRELRNEGFRELGVLHEYYGAGISEVHWGQYFD